VKLTNKNQAVSSHDEPEVIIEGGKVCCIAGTIIVVGDLPCDSTEEICNTPTIIA